jgi:hypothetical protein
MSTFTPSTPIQLQIRKIIFENFNDVDTKFTNDEIFETIKKNGDLNSSWIIDDLEPYINEICDSGLARNIAQNFTTIWLKLFDPVKKLHCASCNQDIFVGESEQKKCPNPSCGEPI